MEEDSKELDSTTNADDNQEVPAEKPPGPKGATLTLSRDDVQPARGGGSPAGPLKADPDPKPDEKDPGPKGTGTHRKDVGSGRG